MPKHTIAIPTLAGAAALMLATAPAAWAELQAPTIWADWQEVYNRFGGSLEAASTEYANGTLTLEGVSYTTDLADVASIANYGTITMVEQADGTVVIEVPANVQADTTTTAEGVEIAQSMSMRHQGLSIVAREDGAERVYDIAADTMTLEVDSVITAQGETASPTTVTMRFAGMQSVYRSGLGDDGQGFEQTLVFDGIDVGSRFAEDGASVDLSYALVGVTSDFEGVYGPLSEGPIKGLSDMNITYDGTLDHSGSTLRIAGDTPDGPLDVSGTSAAGTLAFDLGADSLSYSLASTGAEIVAQVPGFPLPVAVSMEEIGSAFTLPFGEPGLEKPFGMEVTLRDLLVDDALWSLFDPTGQLPRDPATLVLNLDGTAVMNVDLFGDPEAMAQLAGAPGVLKSLTLNELLLTFAGAQLRGSGDVVFPEETLIPEPVGTLELALDGGFALVDKLVALGFLPAQQAGFVKGMSGAVAETVGDDQLESTIEFTPGGGITANGLPLK